MNTTEDHFFHLFAQPGHFLGVFDQGLTHNPINYQIVVLNTTFFKINWKSYTWRAKRRQHGLAEGSKNAIQI